MKHATDEGVIPETSRTNKTEHFFMNIFHNKNMATVEFSDVKLSLTDSELRTFARKFSNIDFFLEILLLKDDELVMSEM